MRLLVTLGSEGVALVDTAGAVQRLPPPPTMNVIDTTGAGDTFTSGFLHAYLVGGSLRQCGDAGCAAGAEIVQVRGAEMDETRWRRVAEKIERILRRDA